MPSKPSPVATRSLPVSSTKSTGRGKKSSTNEEPAVARERLRVAQLLHDTLAQELTGVYLLASVAAERARAHSAETSGKFTEIANLVHQAGLSLAATVQDLRGESAEDGSAGPVRA